MLFIIFKNNTDIVQISERVSGDRLHVPMPDKNHDSGVSFSAVDIADGRRM